MAGLPFSTFAARSLVLAWNADADPNVISYIAYCGTVSRKYTRVFPISQPSVAIPDLVEGKTYFFAVTAVNRAGLQSGPSDELSWTIPPVPSGNYNGLFFEDDEVRPNSAGSFTASVTARCAYTGRLQIAGQQYSFSGKLSQQYQAAQIIKRGKATPLTVQLKIGTGNKADKISGQVTDGVWVSTLSGDRAVSNAKTNPALCAGNYTLILPGKTGSPDIVMGDGFGTVQASAGGAASLAGVLADGTKVTRSAPVSKPGQWPFYVSLYSGKGLMMGWMNFSNQPAITRTKLPGKLDGALTWVRPPDAHAKYYSAGFTHVCGAVGASYVVPINGAGVTFDFTNSQAVFSGGNLGPAFTSGLVIGSKGALSGPGLAMQFDVSKGIFKGNVTNPANGKSWPFSGAVLQDLNAGYGFLLGTNASSRVTIAP